MNSDTMTLDPQLFEMAYIEIYSKAWCPFCRLAKRLLQKKGYEFDEIDVEEDPSRFEEMRDRSGGRWTVPEIFIDGELIGGYQELQALDYAGQLDDLLAEGR